MAFAASTTTTKTPYEAKNPSVWALRPNSRASTTPTIAASPVCTASATAVTAPLPREPRPGETVRLLTDAERTSRDRHRLDRHRPRRAPPRARQRLRRTHLPRHRRRRVHGLAPDGRPRRARGERARVRAGHLERGAQQHRAPARPA